MSHSRPAFVHSLSWDALGNYTLYMSLSFLSRLYDVSTIVKISSKAIFCQTANGRTWILRCRGCGTMVAIPLATDVAVKIEWLHMCLLKREIWGCTYSRPWQNEVMGAISALCSLIPFPDKRQTTPNVTQTRGVQRGVGGTKVPAIHLSSVSDRSIKKWYWQITMNKINELIQTIK